MDSTASEELLSFKDLYLKNMVTTGLPMDNRAMHNHIAYLALAMVIKVMASRQRRPRTSTLGRAVLEFPSSWAILLGVRLTLLNFLLQRGKMQVRSAAVGSKDVSVRSNKIADVQGIKSSGTIAKTEHEGEEREYQALQESCK